MGIGESVSGCMSLIMSLSVPSWRAISCGYSVDVVSATHCIFQSLSWYLHLLPMDTLYVYQPPTFYTHVFVEVARAAATGARKNEQKFPHFSLCLTNAKPWK